jgi:F-type H+-transporting ATPase subunit epsilon
MLVTVFTPKNKAFDNLKAKSVYLPSINGDMQILDNHIPVIASLRPGKVVIEKISNEKISVEVDYGYVQFDNNEMTLVIVDTKLSEEQLKELGQKAISQKDREIRKEQSITEEEFSEREKSEGHR